MGFEFRPIDLDSWADFESLMESRGSPHNCWCTAWIDIDKRADKVEKSAKKATMFARVQSGTPIGLLAYSQGEAIGWCAVAPRKTYKHLGGDETKTGVWSVVCFFIKRSFRGQGLSRHLLKEAEDFARNHGATFIEGYPVAPESPSYRFMGFIPIFNNAGFTHVKNAGSRRTVMLKKLET